MKSGNWKIVPALSALALATMFAPYAHAGCGLYTPVRHPASWQPQIASPRLVLAALAIDDEASHPVRTQHSRDLEREMDRRSR